MIIGIGTDIFEVKRLSEAAISDGDPFLMRAYTEKERAEAKSSNEKRHYLAGKFSAKEAVYKAISSCKIEFRPGEIEILNGKEEKPAPFLLGKTKECFEALYGTEYAIHVSVSHETDIVCSFALAEKL